MQNTAKTLEKQNVDHWLQPSAKELEALIMIQAAYVILKNWTKNVQNVLATSISIQTIQVAPNLSYIYFMHGKEDFPALNNFINTEISPEEAGYSSIEMKNVLKPCAAV